MNKIKFILLLCLFIIIGIGLLFKKSAHERIAKDHVVLKGTIISVVYGKGGNLLIDYEFSCEGEHIEANGSCRLATKKKFDEGNTDILIAVEKGNCHNYTLIENLDDFEELNITTKDTLNTRQ